LGDSDVVMNRKAGVKGGGLREGGGMREKGGEKKVEVGT